MEDYKVHIKDYGFGKQQALDAIKNLKKVISKEPNDTKLSCIIIERNRTIPDSMDVNIY